MKRWKLDLSVIVETDSDDGISTEPIVDAVLAMPGVVRVEADTAEEA